MTNARTITNAWVHRTLPDIFYEEREPIEDGMQQEMALERLIYLLRLRFGDDPTVFMSGAVFISYDITDGNRRVGPDLFISFGVDNEAIRENLPNYWLWEVGKAPEFVMEVASDSAASRDLNEKRELYQNLGIAEYWRFDSKNGERYGQIMAGERLVDGVYQPYEVQEGADGSLRCHSDLLDLGLLLGLNTAVLTCWTQRPAGNDRHTGKRARRPAAGGSPRRSCGGPHP